MRTIKRIFRFLLSIKVKAKALINVFYNKTLYYSASYYPENRKKNMLRAFWYHIKFAIKNGTNDEFYFLYGFDGENSAKENEYIAYSNFMEYRNKNNFELKDKNYNYVAILRDKFIFGQLLKSIGFNTPKNIAILQKKGGGDSQAVRRKERCFNPRAPFFKSGCLL